MEILVGNYKKRGNETNTSLYHKIKLDYLLIQQQKRRPRYVKIGRVEWLKYTFTLSLSLLSYAVIWVERKTSNF